MSQNRSPLPNPHPAEPPESLGTGKLTFYQMIAGLANGSFATRDGWQDSKTVVFLDGHLKIRLPDNKYIPTGWLVNQGDIEAEDWYLLS